MSSTVGMNLESRESFLFNHWLDLSTKYSLISPTLSSFYMNQLLEATEARETSMEKIMTTVCPYCGVLRTTENSRTRFQPRIKKTKHNLRVKDKLKFKRTNIHKNQKRILGLIESNCNQMVINCYNCKKKCRLQLNLPEDSRPDPVPLIAQRKKSRKRKKDYTAGLTIPTALNAIPLLQNKAENTEIKTKAAENRKKNTEIKMKAAENRKKNTEIKMKAAGKTMKNTQIKTKTAPHIVMKYTQSSAMKNKKPPICKKECKKPNVAVVPSQRQKLESFLSNLL